MSRAPILLRLPIPDRDKVDLGLPVCTLDVNQVAIRPRYHERPDLHGLVCLEFNYFRLRTVELCVTPETAIEIAQGIETSSLGSAAFNRISKSALFKARPASTVLDLSSGDADELWADVQHSLWPARSTGALTRNQIGDINQLFFHVVCSSMVQNSAFVSLDRNFLDRAPELRSRYGITVLSPNDTWRTFGSRYSLVAPSDHDLAKLLNEERDFFAGLRSTW